MTDITNERWVQHSTILTLKAEVIKLTGIADAARKEALELRHMLDDAATGTSMALDEIKRQRERADATEKRASVLRKALEWYANPDIYKPRANEKDNRDLSSHARATLEAKP